MRLTNNTQWDSRNLRRLSLAILKEIGGDVDRYRVTFKYSRGRWVTGRGRYDRPILWINLPKPGMPETLRGGTIKRICNDEGHMSEETMTRLVQVFIHEMGHNQGLRHKDMVDSRTLDVSWLDPSKYTVRWKS